MVNQNNETPLHLAAIWNAKEITELLLNAELFAKNKKHLLETAKEHLSKEEVLLKERLEANNNYPLTSNVLFEHLHLLKEAAAVDVEMEATKGKQKPDVEMEATKGKQRFKTPFLAVKEKVDVDDKMMAKNDQKRLKTPLYLAVQEDAKDVIPVLIKWGADVSKLVDLSQEKAEMLHRMLSDFEFGQKIEKWVSM